MAITDDPQGILIAAIVAKWKAAAAITAAMKGPYLHSKPASQATHPNYGIIEPGEAIDDGWTCRNRYWRHEMEFRFYGKTPDLANASANLFLAVFAAENLSMTFATGGLVMHRVVRTSLVEIEAQSVEFASITIKFRTYVPRP